MWHSRLGHHYSAIFRRVISHTQLPLQGKSALDFFCKDCALAKNHKLLFSGTSSVSSTCLALLHCDLWGPSPVLSVSGYKFYLLIVDDFTRYCWFFPLNSKADVYSTFVSFQCYVENLLGNKIKVVRSDSRGEFTGTHFQSYLKSRGILQQFSCPHTLEQNGCVECKHRHLVETARTLLVQSQVPHQFWVEAFLTVVYLINRLPIYGLLQSPWELLFHTSPDYSRLKIFCCSCFPWLKPYISSKLDNKSKHCVFLGYNIQHKGYRCLDLLTQHIYISRHVIFHESEFPYHKTTTVMSSSPATSTASHFNLEFTIPHCAPSINPASSLSPLSPSITSNDALPLHDNPVSSNATDSQVDSSSSQAVNNIHPMITRSKADIFKPSLLSH